MSEDYFTALEGERAQLTLAGAHLDGAARRWRTLEHTLRRAAAVVSLSIILAAMFVIEFPGSASGRVHMAAAHPGWVAVTGAAPPAGGDA